MNKEYISNYNKVTLYRKKEMKFLDNLQKEYNFGYYEVNELAKFPENQLFKAYSFMKRLKSVKYPFRTLLKICENPFSGKVITPKKPVTVDSGIYKEYTEPIVEVSEEQKRINKQQGDLMFKLLAEGHSFATIREMMNGNTNTQPIEDHSSNENVVRVSDVKKIHPINGKLVDLANKEQLLPTDDLLTELPHFEYDSEDSDSYTDYDEDWDEVLD